MSKEQDSVQHLTHMKETLRKLVDHVEELALERKAYIQLAIDEGASMAAVNAAPKQALADPVMREHVRLEYAEMRRAVEEAGIAAFFEGQLQDLPAPEKPN